MKELIITNTEAGQRFDKYLIKYLNEASKSFIYKMLRKKNITLNEKKADGSEKLQTGDVIKIFFADDTLDKFTGVNNNAYNLPKAAYDYPLKIVYEDDDIIMIDKPMGMLSQKAEAKDISLVEYMTAYLITKGNLTLESLNTFKPGICNRLDRNTSGIVVGGKTIKGLQEMSQAFKQRSIHKYYICVVAGIITKRNIIEGFLYKDEQKNIVTITKTAVNKECLPIKTEYIPIAHTNTISLLKINLITGRSHQIRAHLSSIGHPIIGDTKYGIREINKIYYDKYLISSQLLHAYEIEYPKMQLNIHTQLPTDILKLLKGEKLWQPGIQEALEAQH